MCTERTVQSKYTQTLLCVAVAISSYSKNVKSKVELDEMTKLKKKQYIFALADWAAAKEVNNRHLYFQSYKQLILKYTQALSSSPTSLK